MSVFSTNNINANSNLSGATIYSGSTELSTLFATPANITLINSQLATKANLSGATFTGNVNTPSLSATTLSGGTIISGSTDLGNIFLYRSGLTGNQLMLNSLSSGLMSGCSVSINTANTAQVDITPGRLIVVDNWTNLSYPQVYDVTFTGQTGVTLTFLSSSTETHLSISNTGTLLQFSSEENNSQRRDSVMISQINHPSFTAITSVNAQVDVLQSPVAQFRDLINSIGLINSGNTISANGANLSINKSIGALFGEGINFQINKKDPHLVILSATTVQPFSYRTQTGGSTSTVTLIDPTNYDVGGVITAVPNPANTATNQRVYLYPNGRVIIQYGQTTYSSLASAIQGLQSESFTVFKNVAANALLIAIISIQKNCTSLTDTTTSKILYTSKFGDINGAAGGVSTSTLQQAYNNSVTPEIITNSINGALTLENGAGSNSLHVLDIENSGNTITSFITGNGDIYGNSLTATTISGGTYFSGSTPLSNIIQNFVTGVTSGITGSQLQNGLNTYTGGTNTLPTVNVSALTINTLTASGATKLTSTIANGNQTLGSENTNLTGNTLVSNLTANTLVQSPIIYGGTATASTLTLQSSSNSLSTVGADIIFKNGVTEMGRFLAGNSITGGTITYLVVAGGGGGGASDGVNASAGGGGGGGLSAGTANVTLQTYAITVGAGGAGSASVSSPGSAGGNSSIGTLVVTNGGGGGGSRSSQAGTTGGSGGGAAAGTLAASGGAAIGSQGFNGGSTNAGLFNAGAGGGGAGAAAATVTVTGVGTSGGTGVSSSINGTTTFYGGGGGGGTSAGSPVSGGTGGGGNGGFNGGALGSNGTANTGGGGGGGWTGNGGTGGTGVVIISYPTGSLTAQGGTKTTNGANTIHTFTSSGSFIVYSQINSLGVNTNAPGAIVDIASQNANQAALRIRSGSAVLLPNNGDVWNDGTYLNVQGVGLQVTGGTSIFSTLKNGNHVLSGTTSLTGMTFLSGLTVTSLTATRIPFSTTGGQLTDNARYFIDGNGLNIQNVAAGSNPTQFNTCNSTSSANVYGTFYGQTSTNNNATISRNLRLERALGAGVPAAGMGQDIYFTALNHAQGSFIPANKITSQWYACAAGVNKAKLSLWAQDATDANVDNLMELLSVAQTGVFIGNHTQLQTSTSTLSVGTNVTGATWGLNGIQINAVASQFTDYTATGTVTAIAASSFGVPSFSSTTIGVTYTDAYNVFVAGAPISAAATATTLTRSWGLGTRGNANFNNFIYAGGTGVTPTAMVHISGSSASAASLRVDSGSTVTTPNTGDLWNDGTYLNVGVVGLKVTGGTTILTSVTVSNITSGNIPVATTNGQMTNDADVNVNNFELALISSFRFLTGN